VAGVGLAGRQVVVAGGAVGGMAAALLLARAGHRMDATGTVRSASGATLARIRVPDFGGGLDHVLAIRRSRLHDLLAAAVRAAHPAVALRLGTEVTTRPPVAAALAAGDLGRLRAAWAAALPLAGRVLERVQDPAELLVNQVVRVDCARWHDGRRVLVGDAAHAVAPTLGQGANSALVDAAVLACELAAEGPPEAALARYAARRRPAVRRVQDTADRVARLAELASPPLRRARDLLLAAAAGLGSDRRVRAVQQEDPARLLAAVRGLSGR
jgi:2-polyprenyl-6-methoxyphenol hydroxylase-like FAD-dependent oxidoreductase